MEVQIDFEIPICSWLQNRKLLGFLQSPTNTLGWLSRICLPTNSFSIPCHNILPMSSKLKNAQIPKKTRKFFFLVYKIKDRV